jgi:hypothetical protein
VIDPDPTLKLKVVSNIHLYPVPTYSDDIFDRTIKNKKTLTSRAGSVYRFNFMSQLIFLLILVTELFLYDADMMIGRLYC